MDDLIRRQDAIDAIEDCAEFIKDIHQLVTLIDADIAKTKVRAIPSAQQWIPCSERMPENDFTDVLICVHDKRKGCENDFYVIQAYTVGKHWEPTLAVDMTDFDVVAWMQLPEPYKGDE